MAPVDLKHLSSNWKKLQQTLHARKPDASENKTATTTTTTLKRKHSDTSARHGPLNRAKRAKTLAPPSARTHIPSTMSSAPTPPLPSSLPPPPLDPHTGLNPTARLGKYLALDCEMVGTGPPPTHSPSMLARVSLTTYTSALLYDTYVLPHPATTPITSYRTPISGITPFLISPANPTARPFALVQATVAELLRGRVLIGHALRNDLAVLGLKHPRGDVRDTARYGEWRKMFAGGKTPGLRVLAREVLGWEIQGGEHSSVVDARAAMELYRRERRGFEEEGRRVGGEGRGKGGKGGKVEGRLKGERAGGGGGREDGSVVEGGGVTEGDEDQDEDEDEELDEDGSGEESTAATVKTNGVGHSTKKKKKRKKRTKR